MEVSDLLYEKVYESPHLTSEQCEQFIALVDHLGYSIADIKSFDELTPKLNK